MYVGATGEMHGTVQDKDLNLRTPTRYEGNCQAKKGDEITPRKKTKKKNIPMMDELYHDHHGFEFSSIVRGHTTSDYECIVCWETTTRPRKTCCCNRLLCLSCTLKLEENEFGCPMCRKSNYDFETSIDESNLDCKVHCKNNGCPWEGLLREYTAHFEGACKFGDETERPADTYQETQYEEQSELPPAKGRYFDSTVVADVNNLERDEDCDDGDDYDDKDNDDDDASVRTEPTETTPKFQAMPRSSVNTISKVNLSDRHPTNARSYSDCRGLLKDLKLSDTSAQLLSYVLDEQPDDLPHYSRLGKWGEYRDKVNSHCVSLAGNSSTPSRQSSLLPFKSCRSPFSSSILSQSAASGRTRDDSERPNKEKPPLNHFDVSPLSSSVSSQSAASGRTRDGPEKPNKEKPPHNHFEKQFRKKSNSNHHNGEGDNSASGDGRGGRDSDSDGHSDGGGQGGGDSHGQGGGHGHGGDHHSGGDAGGNGSGNGSDDGRGNSGRDGNKVDEESDEAEVKSKPAVHGTEWTAQTVQESKGSIPECVVRKNSSKSYTYKASVHYSRDPHPPSTYKSPTSFTSPQASSKPFKTVPPLPSPNSTAQSTHTISPQEAKGNTSQVVHLPKISERTLGNENDIHGATIPEKKRESLFPKGNDCLSQHASASKQHRKKRRHRNSAMQRREVRSPSKRSNCTPRPPYESQNQLLGTVGLLPSVEPAEPKVVPRISRQLSLETSELVIAAQKFQYSVPNTHARRVVGSLYCNTEQRNLTVVSGSYTCCTESQKPAGDVREDGTTGSDLPNPIEESHNPPSESHQGTADVGNPVQEQRSRRSPEIPQSCNPIELSSASQVHQAPLSQGNASHPARHSQVDNGAHCSPAYSVPQCPEENRCVQHVTCSQTSTREHSSSASCSVQQTQCIQVHQDDDAPERIVCSARIQQSTEHQAVS